MTDDGSTERSIEGFYDEFSTRFLRDLVEGNERVARQRSLLTNAIPATAQTVLVIGFGSGEVAKHVAEIAEAAAVTAVDISGRSLAMAQALFGHRRVSYRKLDVTRERLQGEYDVIVFPDVYEHIPLEARPALHTELNRLLSPDGRIILTLPSPAHQEALRQQGHGLQVVDETVTLADLMSLARDIRASVTYFNSISVWRTNDYIHAVLERGTEREKPLGFGDQIPLKGISKLSVLRRFWQALSHRTGLSEVKRRWRLRRLQNRLSRQTRLP